MDRLIRFAAACAAITALVAPQAHADSTFNARRAVAQTPQGGLVGRSAVAAQGSRGTFNGLRGLAVDGQGGVAAAGSSSFTTGAGGQGVRVGGFDRSADGAVTARGQASASGTHGSADRRGSFTKDADGAASGERSTTLTNADTGVTLEASTTYAKGEGVSRSASCRDASGNTVVCGSR